MTRTDDTHKEYDMDPTENLTETLALARSILADVDRDTDPCPVDTARLAELIQSLDEWIVDGGFLPKQWQPKER